MNTQSYNSELFLTVEISSCMPDDQIAAILGAINGPLSNIAVAGINSGDVLQGASHSITKYVNASATLGIMDVDYSAGNMICE